MKKRKFRIISIILLLPAGVATVFFAAVFRFHIQLTPPSPSSYPVQGVDVSHYQGAIDWALLGSQNIDFAFIKATEGSLYQDETFQSNWEQVKAAALPAGAYHFFSFDSPGKTQAQNYINTVGSLDGMLPPVVDFEFYGDKRENRPDKNSTQKELAELLEALEIHYGRKPILYTTLSAYNAYIEGSLDDFPLWIRNVYTAPEFVGITEWTFWQYTDTCVAEGYEGSEKCIDKNVFNGSRGEWEAWLEKE